MEFAECFEELGRFLVRGALTTSEVGSFLHAGALALSPTSFPAKPREPTSLCNQDEKEGRIDPLWYLPELGDGRLLLSIGRLDYVLAGPIRIAKERLVNARIVFHMVAVVVLIAVFVAA